MQLAEHIVTERISSNYYDKLATVMETMCVLLFQLEEQHLLVDKVFREDLTNTY